jgi:hypothetical protein
MKEEEVGLSEVKDIFNIRPNWSMNRNHRVKAGDYKFQDPPQVVVPIVGLVVDQCKGCVDLRGKTARNEPWEELHEGFTHGGIFDKTKAQGAKSLEPGGEDNGIERHYSNDTSQANFLKMVIEGNDILHMWRLQAMKYGEGLLEDFVHLRAGGVGIAIIPQFADFAMCQHYVIVTYHHVLSSSHDLCMAAGLDVYLCEGIDAVHTNMVFFSGQVDDVKATRSKGASVHCPVAMTRGDNGPPHNITTVSA